MNRETDTVFLQTIGKFIAAQVQLAVTPLIDKIREQDELIDGLKVQRIEDNNALCDRLLNAENSLSKLQAAPKPEIDRDVAHLAISAIIESAVAALPKPEPIDYDAINEVIWDYMEKQIQQLPKPKDGKDGADVVAAFRDSDRHLILTLSNGVVKDIGQIHGENGKDGAPGTPGTDGRDGFGFDDFNIEYDGEKTFTFYFVRGEDRKEFKFVTPIVIYRGIWRQGKYLKGDAATSEGSMFIAKENTETVPGTTGSDWQLATKRGREGKPGEKGKDGVGKPGRDGRDLTQMAFDGTKY